MNWESLRRSPLEIALCLLLLLMVGVTFAQVVYRYLLQASLAWSEEMARFTLMWLASLSAAYAFKQRAHFALRFVVDALDPRLRRVVAALVTACMATFLAVFSYEALRFTLEVRDMVAAGTGMSMAIPYSSAFVGGVLMLYYVLLAWWRPVPAPDRGPQMVDGAPADGEH